VLPPSPASSRGMVSRFADFDCQARCLPLPLSALSRLFLSPSFSRIGGGAYAAPWSAGWVGAHRRPSLWSRPWSPPGSLTTLRPPRRLIWIGKGQSAIAGPVFSIQTSLMLPPLLIPWPDLALTPTTPRPRPEWSPAGLGAPGHHLCLLPGLRGTEDLGAGHIAAG
jgi:hypothetical protein